MRPIAIPSYIRKLWNDGANTPEENIALINQRYKALHKGTPEVSVVIPAYNEEKNILRTLLSLSSNITVRSVEIIVVNNNSTDNTKALVQATGIQCILETTQGITAARNSGLAAATGKYILNADADSIYQADWIEKMVTPLAGNDKISVTYSRFGFIPTDNTLRISYFIYENIADITRWFNKKYKEEAVNVYGFSSGFRRTEGLQVDGFNHPPGTNEDGWLALKLRDKGFGKLHCVTSSKAMVWTADRRIGADGGLWKAFFLRFKRVIFPSKEMIIRKDL
jgi:glycosyltransferase involved in cell wall biosynthesis